MTIRCCAANGYADGGCVADGIGLSVVVWLVAGVNYAYAVAVAADGAGRGVNGSGVRAEYACVRRRSGRKC